MQDDLFGEPTQRKAAAVTGRRRIDTQPMGNRSSSRSNDSSYQHGGTYASGSSSIRQACEDATPAAASSSAPHVLDAPPNAMASSFDADDDDTQQAFPPASVALPDAELSNSWDEEGEDKSAPSSANAKSPPPKPPSTTGTIKRVAKTFFDEDDDQGSATQPVFDGTSRRKQLQTKIESTGGRGTLQHSQKYSVEKELVLDDVPEMTDAGNEDITNVVADAPKVHNTKQVQSLSELEDAGLGRLKVMLQNGEEDKSGIDVSLLTQFLIPQDFALDPDVHWDEEILLTEVASDLQREREEHERLSLELAISG